MHACITDGLAVIIVLRNTFITGSTGISLMTPPKTISIIGYKNSGKTRVVETLVRELTNRGSRVVSVKHTIEDIELDTPGKDSERHRKAGAKASAILHNEGTAIFYDYPLKIQDAVKKLGEADYVIIEGFKTFETHPRVIVPRDKNDIEKVSTGLELAVVNVNDLMLETNLPVFTLDESKELTDLVEKKAYSLLPGLNCMGCGYKDCHEMGKAILRGEGDPGDCIVYKTDFTLKVNGEDVPLNNFVRNTMMNVMIGFIKTLKAGESVKKVALVFCKDE
jgi:molybdopterin-guanine dinucleotide biosynthesis protein B